MINFFRFEEFNFKWSYFNRLTKKAQLEILQNIDLDKDKIVSVIAFCIMPTHVHFLLRQNKINGISNYTGRILNSYSKFFNFKHKRIGPLWAGRFKSVRIKSDEQLLHLTRYIHLNPTSAGLVKNPGEWNYSSYKEFITGHDLCDKQFICDNDIFNINPEKYEKFVNDRKDYQRKLSLIKNSLIDNYSG